MDSRADRAIIVRLVRGMLNGILLGRGRLGRRYAGDGGAACELFEMDVSERKDKLQRHRCKREPTPAPLSGPSPTHWQNASTPAWDSLQRSRSRANTFRSKTLLASINWLDCCPNVTGRCRPTCAVSSTFCQRTTPFAISFATYQRSPRRPANVRDGVKTGKVSSQAMLQVASPRADLGGQFTRRASGSGGRSSGCRRSAERVSSSTRAIVASTLRQNPSNICSILFVNSAFETCPNCTTSRFSASICSSRAPNSCQRLPAAIARDWLKDCLRASVDERDGSNIEPLNNSRTAKGETATRGDMGLSVP
jgi:hypothetical protein